MEVNYVLGMYGSNVELRFADEEGFVSPIGVVASKYLRTRSENSNPMNMALVETKDKHPAVTAEGAFVYKLIFLAGITGGHGSREVVTITPTHAWEDNCLDNENLAAIFTPEGAGTSADKMDVFKAAWDRVKG